LQEIRAAGKLAKGGAEKGVGRRGNNAGPQATRITLAEQGVDKHLADEARKLAAMPADKFEADLAKTVAVAVAAVDGSKEVITAARADSHREKKEQREGKERQLADKIAALPEAKFGVILADPEWKFEFWSEKGQTNSSAENHYPTSALDVIKARDVPRIAAEDCVLFLWATVPMLPQALEVMAAWGFGYVSNFAWVKDRIGTGYWNRNKHELLLIGTRGKVPAPAPGDQWVSALEAEVRKHSEKPAVFYELIEAYFPNLPKIELNARGPARPGWQTWGLEAAEAAE
jgi:N6-adenosine-specific RNA methylase IME4